MITRNPATMPTVMVEAPGAFDPGQPKHIMYGYIYNRYARQGSIAPVGWHVPDASEIATLRSYVASLQSLASVGRALKSARTFGRNATAHPAWMNHGTAFGTDLYNFSAIPGGRRARTGGFVRLGTDALFGTPGETVWVLGYDGGTYFFSFLHPQDGTPVRCIRDLPAGQVGDAPADGGYCLDITDIDGNTYKTVRIGTQVWTVQNLATTRYNNGTAIPNLTGADGWANTTSGARCAYENNENYVFTNTNWLI